MSDGAIFLLILIALILSGWVVAFSFRRELNQQKKETERVRR
ncbi:hypothetical protein [Vreelandella lionensis]|nr:hypothetical protein [Halomonas lionensis]